MRKLVISKKSYALLRQQLNGFLQEKSEIQQRLGETWYRGNLMENGEYLVEIEHLDLVEERIKELAFRLSNAIVVTSRKKSANKVGFGSTVILYNLKEKREDTFTIVGDSEADPDKDEVSISSPIGEAILNHKAGDTISVNLPCGPTVYKVRKIYFQKKRQKVY